MLIHLKFRQNRSGRNSCGWIWGWTSWKSHRLNCMRDIVSKMPLWNVQEGRKAWLWWKEGGGAQDTQEVYGGLVLRIPVHNTVWMNGGPTLPASSNRYVLSLSLLYWTQPKSSSREERGDDGGKSGEREEEWRGRGGETKSWAVTTPGAGAEYTNKPGYCPDLPFWTACGHLQQTSFLWE